MKIGIILEILKSNDFEKAWNAFRFAETSLASGHEVKVFLMSDAVYYQYVSAGQFNIEEQVKRFLKAGGIIFADETSLSARQMNCPKEFLSSTMQDCVKMVEWADRTLTF